MLPSQKLLCGLACTGLVLLRVSSATAQVFPQPDRELAYQNLTALRVNPLGLVDLAELTFRRRLYRSESDALTQNFVGLGVAPGVSPAWGRLGVLAEVQPLTLLKLWASFELIGYYGSFDLMASFPSASADFSDSAIEDRVEDDRAASYATTGRQINLGATLQVKAGPVALRGLFRAFRASFDLREGDRVFYDQLFDVLVPNDGWTLVNDVDLLWVSTFGLTAGLRWSLAEPLYDDDRHYGPGEAADAPSNSLHRLGLLAAYTLAKNPGGRLDTATAVLIAQWHLEHRWRTGEDVSGALPFVALALQLRGNLLAD
jgi:hypothetical protein